MLSIQLLYAILLGVMTLLLSELNRSESERWSKFNETTGVMLRQKLPRSLIKAIQYYLEETDLLLNR